MDKDLNAMSPEERRDKLDDLCKHARVPSCSQCSEEFLGSLKAADERAGELRALRSVAALVGRASEGQLAAGVDKRISELEATNG